MWGRGEAMRLSFSDLAHSWAGPRGSFSRLHLSTQPSLRLLRMFAAAARSLAALPV